MKALKLESCLAAQIEALIDLRRVAGGDYRGQALMLGYFDQFLVQQNLAQPRISREIIDGYQRTLSHLAPRTRENRLSVVGQLCKYIATSDPLSHVPEWPRTIRSDQAFQPYIYRLSEIQSLLAAASELPPKGSLRPQTYRTLLGLLYTTGIRIGEAFGLNLEDFNEGDRRLYIAAGKFRKSRWVPLSACTARELQQYVQDRLSMKPSSPDAPLFLNQRRQRLHHCTVNQTFWRLLQQSDIFRDKRKRPRIHDLRHTFAVHRLLAWYRDGEDVNARLPWLATYMGHVNINSTQVYLRPTAELWQLAAGRFHRHYLDHVRSQEGK
jgi:site-specific recombinase XerD